MKHSFRYARLFAVTMAVACIFALPRAAHAGPITVLPTVTDLGTGLFSYNYQVINTSVFDYSAISLVVPVGANTVQNLVAPSGFRAFFDPGLGQVDFVENTVNFSAGSSTSGFSFRSPFGPQSSVFSALRLDLVGFPETTTGTTLAPGVSAVPDSGPAMLLLGSSLLVLVAIQIGRGKNVIVDRNRCQGLSPFFNS